MTNISGSFTRPKKVNHDSSGPQDGGNGSQSNQVAAPAIPEGYKQTDVGIIPEDWECLTVDDVVSFVGGSQPEKSTFTYKDTEGYIRLIQIRDYKSDKHIVYIPKALARKTCNEKDIMIGRYGPPIFQILRGIEGAYNVALIKAIPRGNIEQAFLYNFLKTDALFELMDMLSQRSSGQTGVELPALKAYPIGLPPKEEQTAIANALSDVDALLSELEKLIAKKQAIKTATMQQLLTGKTRLPAFAYYNEADENQTLAEGAKHGQHKYSSGTNVNVGACDDGALSNSGSGGKDSRCKGTKPSELGEIPDDWEVVALGDIGQTIIGLTYSPNDVSDYGTLVLRSSNVQKNNLAYQNNVFVDMDLPDRVIVKEGDILVCVRNGSRNLIGKCALIDKQAEGFAFGAFMSIYRTKPYGFMFYQFQSNIIQNQINEIMGATINQITNKDMAGFKVPLPSDKEEQTAIANILTDMDTEIQTLEQRLSKTRQIKQGMMQELLTGRTRLPF